MQGASSLDTAAMQLAEWYNANVSASSSTILTHRRQVERKGAIQGQKAKSKSAKNW